MRFPPGATIVGIAALALGVIGLMGLALTVAWLAGADVPSVLPGVNVEGSEKSGHPAAAITAALGSGIMSALLAVFGAGLMRRASWSPLVGRLWASLMFPFSLFGAWVGWLNLKATDQGLIDAATGTPMAMADTARVTAVTGVVFGAALSWAVAFACLAWLRGMTNE